MQYYYHIKSFSAYIFLRMSFEEEFAILLHSVRHSFIHSFIAAHGIVNYYGGSTAHNNTAEEQDCTTTSMSNNRINTMNAEAGQKRAALPFTEVSFTCPLFEIMRENESLFSHILFPTTRLLMMYSVYTTSWNTFRNTS